MGVLDAGAANLCGAENARRDEDAPEAAHVELFDQEVGANATEEAPAEAAEGEDGDVHYLPLLDEGGSCAVVVVAPEGLCVVADVACKI